MAEWRVREVNGKTDVTSFSLPGEGKEEADLRLHLT